MSHMNTFEKFQEELQNDLEIDDLTLHDVQMKLPAVKHKWVARLIQLKFQREKLEQNKSELLNNIVTQLKEQEVVKLSERSLYTSANKHEEIVNIGNQIKELDLLILYLEKIEKVCSQTTFDVKNIIDIKKLELT